MISLFRSSLAITSPTTPARALSTPRRDMAAKTLKSGPRTRAELKSAASIQRFHKPSMRRRVHRARPRLRRQDASSTTRAKRATQRRIIKALIEAGTSSRAAAEASVPALVALEEARIFATRRSGHRHGQADQGPRRHLARHALREIKATRWCRRRENRITGMIEAGPTG